MRKQTSWVVRTVRCADGERLPVLVDGATGLPDFDAARWVLTTLRTRNLASATIEQALRSLIPLFEVARDKGIDLARRLEAGRILDPSEIEAIVNAAKLRIISTGEADLNCLPHPSFGAEKKGSKKRTRAFPSDLPSSSCYVSSSTAHMRLNYIRAFLDWRVTLTLLRCDKNVRNDLSLLWKLVEAELQCKTPVQTRRSVTSHKMGLTQEDQEKLSILFSKNSFGETPPLSFTESRNRLIFHLLITSGMRRSELLGLRVKDFNAQAHEILILRRPDDIQDPRLNEPNAKTRERAIPLSAETYNLFKQHLKSRQLIVKGKHDFLISSRTGAPLSKESLNKIFRRVSPNVTPHTLRHTFCENLTQHLYEKNTPTELILKYLRHLCGWSDNSKTPLRYIQRFIHKESSIASIKMQQTLKMPWT